jgi:hypothetical protein
MATRHASSEDAVGVIFVPGNTEATAKDGRATVTKATIVGTKEGAKGGKKGQKMAVVMRGMATLARSV